VIDFPAPESINEDNLVPKMRQIAQAMLESHQQTKDELSALRERDLLLYEEVKQTNVELKQTNVRIDQTNDELKQTNQRLDHLTEEVQGLRTEVQGLRTEVQGLRTEMTVGFNQLATQLSNIASILKKEDAR
jgi:chromosome segregation ATPase